MTNEELQAHINALRKAFWADQIQERAVENEAWGWPQASRVLSDNYEYRIKPQPREYFLRVDTRSNYASLVTNDPDVAKAWDMLKDIGQTIRVREAVDD